MSDTKKTTKKPAAKKTTKKTVAKEVAPKTKKVTKKAPVKKSGDLAVIQTGGKQYLVCIGDTVKVEKLIGEIDTKITFDKVLLVTKGKDVNMGTPYIDGAKVEAIILEQGRAKKITVLRYKPKVRYRKKKGHRQPFTKVEITKI